MADLLRWEDTPYGGLTGHAGALKTQLFQIWRPERGMWVLTSTLPGQGAGTAVANASDPGELKARAEELLREFASSLGAVFPGAGRPCCDHCNNLEGDPDGHDYGDESAHDGPCAECKTEGG